MADSGKKYVVKHGAYGDKFVQGDVITADQLYSKDDPNEVQALLDAGTIEEYDGSRDPKEQGAAPAPVSNEELQRTNGDGQAETAEQAKADGEGDENAKKGSK